MICVDRKKRITAEKVLAHSWFKKVLRTSTQEDATALDPEVIISL
jgi:hypothetical protein